MPQEELPPWVDAAITGSTGAGAAAATFMAAALGHPEGGIVAAAGAPAAQRALREGALRVRRRWLRQAERAVAEGATTAGLSPAELVSQLVETPPGGELFWEAVQAAAHAGVDAKIGALGRSMAAGTLGAEEVDRELLFVRAMADLETPHLRILEHLDSAHSPGYPDHPYSLHLDRLRELPGIGAAIHPLLGTLERHGLVEALPPNMEHLFAEFSSNVARGRGGGFSRPDTEGRWKISRFGRECLDRLRAAGLRSQE